MTVPINEWFGQNCLPIDDEREAVCGHCGGPGTHFGRIFYTCENSWCRHSELRLAIYIDEIDPEGVIGLADWTERRAVFQQVECLYRARLLDQLERIMFRPIFRGERRWQNEGF